MTTKVNTQDELYLDPLLKEQEQPPAKTVTTDPELNLTDEGTTTDPITTPSETDNTIGDAPLLPPAQAGSLPPIPDAHGTTKPITREVQDNELVSFQLDNLLRSDSRYIQQARKEGLERGGGLGGTMGIGSAIRSAIQAGVPIAAGDAQAYRDAAAQNQNDLNAFGLANLQRVTQLELGHLQASTQLQVAEMTTNAQLSIAQLQSATQRDIARASNATQIRVTELEGVIRGRLADQTFAHNQLLNDQLAADRLENTALQGEYGLAQAERQAAAQRETNYTNLYVGAYDGALARIAALNEIEMDDAARQRSEDTIWEGFYSTVDLIAALFPDVTPIESGGG
jgi:hypothetical protein